MILPTLARHHVNREDNSSQSAVDFRNTMDWGVRMILLLGVPAAIGIAVLAQPMLLVLFMRGSFTLTDVHAASYSCLLYTSTLQKTETLSHLESSGRIPLRPFAHKYSEKNQINGLLIIVSYR